MLIKLKCKKCNTNFKISFQSNNDRYYYVCPNCGNSEYKEIEEIEKNNDKLCYSVESENIKFPGYEREEKYESEVSAKIES